MCSSYSKDMSDNENYSISHFEEIYDELYPKLTDSEQAYLRKDDEL